MHGQVSVKYCYIEGFIFNLLQDEYHENQQKVRTAKMNPSWRIVLGKFWQYAQK